MGITTTSATTTTLARTTATTTTSTTTTNNTFPQSQGENGENGNGNAAQAMIAVASGAATLAVLSLSLFAVRWYRRSMRKQKEAKAEDNLEEFVGKLEELGSTGKQAQGTVRMNDAIDIEAGVKTAFE